MRPVVADVLFCVLGGPGTHPSYRMTQTRSRGPRWWKLASRMSRLTACQVEPARCLLLGLSWATSSQTMGASRRRVVCLALGARFSAVVVVAGTYKTWLSTQCLLGSVSARC